MLAGDTILMEGSVALGVSHKALAGVGRTAHVVRHDDDDEFDDKVKRGKRDRYEVRCRYYSEESRGISSSGFELEDGSEDESEEGLEDGLQDDVVERETTLCGKERKWEQERR